MAMIKGGDPKVHKVRFTLSDDFTPGRYTKIHEVTVGDKKAAQMTTWVNDIVLDKLDVEFLLESEA